MTSELVEHVKGSRRIYDGRIVALREDTVTLADGRAVLREVVEHAEVFHHVGLLVNEPSGTSGLPFAQSSDDCDSTDYRAGPTVHPRSAA